MPDDESIPQDKTNPELPPGDKTAGPTPESPESPAPTENSLETKGGRRKPAEHKEARENKDYHQKIKALRAEIDELKKQREAWEKETASLREEARAAHRDAADWKDRMMRALAETDNLRKRLEREKAEYFQFALAEVLKDILPVVDNLERAIRAHDAPDEFREGIVLIIRQLSDVLTKQGVTPVVCADGRFDPSFHQALLTEEVEGIEEPMIGEELQKGYMLNDRLLRPALVKVLMPRKG